MAFTMVPPWCWLLCKPILAVNFGSPHGFPTAARPKDYECLIEDFFNAANSVAFVSQADDIVAKVFSSP